MSGPTHIPASEIQAWAALTGALPERWETLTLTAIDREYVRIAADHLETQTRNAAKKKGGDNG